MNGFEKTGHRVLTHSGFVFKPVYIKRPRIAALTTTDEPSVATSAAMKYNCWLPQTTKLLYLQL